VSVYNSTTLNINQLRYGYHHDVFDLKPVKAFKIQNVNTNSIEYNIKINNKLYGTALIS